MTQFERRFLDQFPAKLQPQLEHFGSWVEELKKQIDSVPNIKWPPPTYPPDAFNYFVELVWQANAAKGSALCQGMIRSLNHADYLCFAVLLRAFFEQVLLIRQYWTRLYRHIAAS